MREYSADAELLDLVEYYGFELLDSAKVPVAFPAVDLVLRRAKVTDVRVYQNARLRALRKVRVPVSGNFTWELVLRRRDRPSR